MNRKVELLAPAGNKDCLIAAIEAGCDAIYLSGNFFGARSFAKNFTNEELVKAINYSHLYGVKVYVAVNTLIYENEVDEFLNYIDFLHKNNVDAIIIQDLGMFDLIRKTYPNLEIHASTQMHIHNIEGVKLAKKLGINRVVLARETSIEAIKKIKKEVDMELEVFIHGALCISYSGQCLMSSLIGSRSGNRGSCAGCCRQSYDLIINNKRVNSGYLLSTKDLYTLEHINELLDSGVDSLKIEGRMKSKEYVYQVVSLYRKAIDEYLNNNQVNIKKEDIINLKKVFNREFTKGFIFKDDNYNIVNQYRPNHIGVNLGKVISYKNGQALIKLEDELNIGDGIRIVDKDSEVGMIVTRIIKNKNLVKTAKNSDLVYLDVKNKVSDSSQLLKTLDVKLIKNINDKISNKSRKVLIDIEGIFKLNDKIRLKVSDGINNIDLESDYIIDKSINNTSTKDMIFKQLNKLGNSIYKINQFKCIIDDNIFIPNIVLNELKRKMIDELNRLRLYKIKYVKEEYKIDLPNFNKESNLNLLEEDVYKENNQLVKRLPRVINNYDDYNELVLIGELGSINKYKDFYTDFSFNVTNSYAVAFLHSLGAKKVTLSYELDDDQIKDIINSYHKRYNKHPNLELIVESFEEVMISKFNLLKKYNVNYGYLKDRFNNLYLIKIKNKLMYIYNYKKRVLNNHQYYYDIGINNLRINNDTGMLYKN